MRAAVLKLVTKFSRRMKSPGQEDKAFYGRNKKRNKVRVKGENMSL